MVLSSFPNSQEKGPEVAKPCAPVSTCFCVLYQDAVPAMILHFLLKLLLMLCLHCLGVRFACDALSVPRNSLQYHVPKSRLKMAWQTKPLAAALLVLVVSVTTSVHGERECPTCHVGKISKILFFFLRVRENRFCGSSKLVCINPSHATHVNNLEKKRSRQTANAETSYVRPHIRRPSHGLYI